MKATIRICFLAASVSFGAFTQNNSAVSREVHELYLEDQKDRGVGGESLPWEKIEPRDRSRRMRIHELLSTGALQTAEDFHDAAFILSTWPNAG